MIIIKWNQRIFKVLKEKDIRLVVRIGGQSLLAQAARDELDSLFPGGNNHRSNTRGKAKFSGKAGKAVTTKKATSKKNITEK